MIYRAFIVLMFIVVLVGSVWLGGQQREPVSQTTVDETAGSLGYAARDARAISTGPDGHPLYTINARLINEPPGTTQIQLQQMSMTFRDESGQEWTARADKGVAEQDVENVELSGNVQVAGTFPGSETPMVITTEKLFVDSRSQMVTTPELVTLTTTGAKMTGKGLSVNLNDGKVQLKSNVHGTYSP
jgi:LPS export ABC transporter protein LptC